MNIHSIWCLLCIFVAAIAFSSCFYQSHEEYENEAIGKVTVVSKQGLDWIPESFPMIVSEYPFCAGPFNRTETKKTLLEPPWNDMDWQGVDGKRHAACGVQKCYLNSKSDSSVGYLMANSHAFDFMVHATEIKHDLHNSLNANVLEVPGQTPYMVQLSPSMACFLTDYNHQSALNYKLKSYPKDGKVVVHKVRRAPEPTFLLRSYMKETKFREGWIKFIKDNQVNATAVYDQMTLEFAEMQKVLQMHPALVCDWQVLVDVQGKFHHIDVDRMFQDSCHRERKLLEYEERYKIFVPLVLKEGEQIARDFERCTGAFEK